MKDPIYSLITSSGLFSIPVIYGLYKNKQFLSSISMICMLASMNYWKHPELDTIHHQIDVYLSRTTGIVYFLYGYYNIQGFARYIGVFNGVMILLCYIESCKLYKQKDDLWVQWHMAFHLFTTINKLIVIHN